MNKAIISQPRFTTEELDRDKLIIGDALANDDQIIEGSTAWDVLVKHVIAPKHLRMMSPQQRWEMLQDVAPANGFFTDCPTWCTMNERDVAHVSEVRNDDGRATTTHASTPLNVEGVFCVVVYRDDSLNENGILASEHGISFFSDSSSLTVRDARTLSHALTTAATELERILGEEA